MSFSAVPDLQNGVRHPATIATRRPFPPGITFSSRDPHAEAGTIRTKPTTGSAGRPRHCVSMETEFSHRARAAALQSMAAEPVDLLVIGGGITGAGIARDAALRGIRTALVDKGDFGSGTSSRSEEHTSELQSHSNLVRRLLLAKQ